MRKQPGSPPPVTPQQSDKVINQVREYEVITPLFGGGVAPNEADPVTVIRGTEVRGQLRFWWRACRGGQFEGDLVKMKQAEDKLWGSAYKEVEQTISQYEVVQISVETIQRGVAVKASTVAPQYAAFPLQSDPKPLQKDVSFRLIISFPKSQQKEVEAALWAWETFGGIGARTRRGFGALHLLKFNGEINTDLPSSNVQEATFWVKSKLGGFVASGKCPKDLPHLEQTVQFRIIGPFQNPLIAWRTLITKLSSFRQAPDGRSGRSNWPEPEAIREFTKRRHYKYKPLNHPRKFPRAAFGLPIIFHFKDAEKGDPKDTTLQGMVKDSNPIERLASPLILRPVICIDNRTVGLALVLEGPHTPPGGLILTSGNDHPRSVEGKLEPNEAKTIPVLKGETDVLKAFMNYLGGNTQ